MTDAPPIARLYISAQRSFRALTRTIADDQWATPVACCPGWTVRDVVSHVAGLADDLLAGRVAGAGTDAWTAAQVERWSDAPVHELLEQWDAQAPAVAGALEQLGETRPVIDCCSHEHDVRAALGRPGDRAGEVVTFAVPALGRTALTLPLVIELADGRRLVSPAPAPAGDEVTTVRGLDGFELFRSRLGRRSATQVQAYDWSDPPSDELLDDWFIFGPADADIVE